MSFTPRLWAAILTVSVLSSVDSAAAIKNGERSVWSVTQETQARAAVKSALEKHLQEDPLKFDRWYPKVRALSALSHCPSHYAGPLVREELGKLVNNPEVRQRVVTDLNEGVGTFLAESFLDLLPSESSGWEVLPLDALESREGLKTVVAAHAADLSMAWDLSRNVYHAQDNLLQWQQNLSFQAERKLVQPFIATREAALLAATKTNILFNMVDGAYQKSLGRDLKKSIAVLWFVKNNAGLWGLLASDNKLEAGSQTHVEKTFGIWEGYLKKLGWAYSTDRRRGGAERLFMRLPRAFSSPDGGADTATERRTELADGKALAPISVMLLQHLRIHPFVFERFYHPLQISLQETGAQVSVRPIIQLVDVAVHALLSKGNWQEADLKAFNERVARYLLERFLGWIPGGQQVGDALFPENLHTDSQARKDYVQAQVDVLDRVWNSTPAADNNPFLNFRNYLKNMQGEAPDGRLYQFFGEKQPTLLSLTLPLFDAVGFKFHARQHAMAVLAHIKADPQLLSLVEADFADEPSANMQWFDFVYKGWSGYLKSLEQFKRCLL